jgi:hypothetical protein
MSHTNARGQPRMMRRRRPGAKPEPEPERKYIGVQMNPALWHRIKIVAAIQNRTVIEVVDDALREYVEKAEAER